MSEQNNYIPLLSEFKSGIAGGFVTDISQVRGGAELSANAIQKVDFNKAQNKILFYNSRAEGASPVASIDVSSFVSGGLLKAVTLNDSILTMTFSLSGGDQTVEIPLESIFSPDNYYSKTDIDDKLRKTPFLRFDYSSGIGYFEVIYHTDPDESIKDITFAEYNGVRKFYAYRFEYSNNGHGSDTTLHLYENSYSMQYNKPDGKPFSDKVYASHDGKLYLYDEDGENLCLLSVGMIKLLSKNEDNPDVDLTSIEARLEALENKNFPITITTSFLPAYSSFDGTSKNVTVKGSFKKGDDSYTPAKVEIYQKKNGAWSIIYENATPTTNTVQHTVNGIISTSTTFKIKITTAEGVTKEGSETTFYVYPPLYVGFAPRDTDFSDIDAAATDNGFKKYYSSAFSKNLSITNTVNYTDIFVLIPNNKKLSSFTYSSSNLDLKFDKLEGTFTYKTDLGNLSYNVYRSQSDGMIEANNTFDKINITLS